MKVACYIVKWILIVVVLGYSGLALFALLLANKMVFPAPSSSYQDSEDIIRIPAGEASWVSAIHLTHPKATHLIIYSQGNGEDLGRSLSRLHELNRRGFAVLAWDYPGYGTSPGNPTEKSVLEASLNVLQYARDELGVPLDRIILYGRSLGGSPSIWLAREAPVAGLILEGTYTSTFRVMTRVRLLPWDIFPNLSWIPEIECPVLLLHGTNDQTVAFWHGKKLLEAAPEPKSFVWFDGGGHNNLVEDFPEIYYPTVEGFIRGL